VGSAGGGKRVTRGQRAALDVHFAAVDGAQRRIQTQAGFAVVGVFPSLEGAQHLGGKSLVDLVEVEVLQGQTGTLQHARHGIGRRLHEEPSIPNFGRAGTGPVLKPGMTLAIEPMLCLGRADVVVKNDGWTAVSADGSLAAHFEHTVAVTEDGCDILSAP